MVAFNPAVETVEPGSAPKRSDADQAGDKWSMEGWVQSLPITSDGEDDSSLIAHKADELLAHCQLFCSRILLLDQAPDHQEDCPRKDEPRIC